MAYFNWPQSQAQGDDVMPRITDLAEALFRQSQQQPEWTNWPQVNFLLGTQRQTQYMPPTGTSPGPFGPGQGFRLPPAAIHELLAREMAGRSGAQKQATDIQEQEYKQSPEALAQALKLALATRGGEPRQINRTVERLTGDASGQTPPLSYGDVPASTDFKTALMQMLSSEEIPPQQFAEQSLEILPLLEARYGRGAMRRYSTRWLGRNPWISGEIFGRKPKLLPPYGEGIRRETGAELEPEDYLRESIRNYLRQME